MGFLDAVKHQFIEIIEWLDQTPDTMVYRFPVHNQEIKANAQLIVRENQAALFVNEGRIADLFAPGRYQLNAKNIPILSDLFGWKYGFESPFKAEVYFFNTRLFTDLKWGTTNPVMMRDTDFGMIRLRAFGTYATKIADPKKFFSTIVGTRGLTETNDILGQLRSTIISRFSDSVAESKIAALDLASKYDELSGIVNQKLAPEFGSYGLELSRFYIENMSLPEEVEAAIDKRSSLGVLGDKMQQYAQLQTANAIPIAAANPGGLAGAGAGLGAGLAIGGAMGQAFGGQFGGASGPSPMAPPPPPPPAGGAAAPRWTVAVDGKTYGPFTDDALRAMIANGQVSPGAHVWRPGASAWAPLTDYPELGAAAPPPPPPPK